MADMDFARYEMMVEDCATETEIVEYRNSGGKLVASILIDRLTDGHSLVYSFFDPDLSSRGLGNFMILDHIRRAHENTLPFLYLGYWVSNSPKMDYKARFQPCEVLGSRGWQQLNRGT
jgi:arginine-tRNA-protein transferase